MNSRRVGQTLVRSLRTSVSAHHVWLLIAFAMLALGVGGASARWVGKKDGTARQAAPPIIATPAAYAHRVSMLMRDISATPVTTVSAASYEGVTIAPDSIVAAFGAQLATQTAIASDADPSTPGIQLPTQLANTTVEVNGRRAGLFFVSAGQVNYVMPPATESGMVNVVIRSGDGTTSNGTVQIAQVAPSVFTANADGRGVPAAVLLRVKANGRQSYEELSRPNPADGRKITMPIDLGPAGDRVFLILYVTGLRRANDDNSDGNVNESIRLLIGGNEIVPLFAGRHPDFVGLDQINVEIPRTLEGLGIVKVSATAAGFTASNLVDIEIAGAVGMNPPLVNGFGSAALAGTRLLINGSGFSAIADDNVVQIAGQAADVESATATQLTVMVPPGVISGQVSVRTNQGQGVSANFLPVRTSISGVVENTSRAPLGGVQVKVTGTNITAVTSNEGVFVLPDVLQGAHFVEVDGGTVGTNPPYPKVTMKITALQSRDNPFSRSIALQQSTGSGGGVGGNGTFAATGNDEERLAASIQQTPLTIQTGDYKLEIQNGTKADFPTGATFGTIVLTPLREARTPVDLPPGYFSAAIVQITPFGVKLDPGAKLILPNTDGFPASAPAILFRYEPREGVFIQETAKAAVTADGRFIETEPGAIKETSFYFAAVLRNTTTINGRVVERNGSTPVVRASVNYRGREAFTDGNGSYILRYVPVRDGERVSVDASVRRASGRVDRVVSASVPAVLGGTTKIPPLFMPGVQENRPPTILVQQKIDIDEGRMMDVPVIVTDPDLNQTVTVRLEAPGFVRLIKTLSANASAYALQISPNFNHAGEYRLVITATDNASPPGIAIEDLTLVVKNVNRPPVANEQAVSVDEDTTAAIRLTGSDPDNDNITYAIVSPPANGTLSGAPPNVTYRPALNFNGVDQFSFKTNDGRTDGNTALVVITVRPINDPPVLSVPGAQTVDEAQTLNFAVSGADVDSTAGMALTATGLPAGATFTPATATSAQFRWTPGFDQAGTYTVTFKATDAGTPPLSDTKQVLITVRNVNRPPVANGQAITIDEDAQAAVILQGSDPDNDNLTFAIVTPPANGTLTGAPPNVTYRPALNFNGVDQFSFKANDGQTDGTPAQVSVTVRPVNDPPVLIVPGTQTADEGVALNFAVSATDVDGTVGMTLMATGVPAGAAFTAATGTFVWTPNFDQSGIYTVTFKATDGGTPPLSDTKQVIITVRNTNRPPVANGQAVTMGEDAQAAITLQGSDPDGNSLTFAIVTPPANGTLTGAPPNVTYRPALNFNGADQFSFKANDGLIDGTPAQVVITVTPVNDPPVLTVPGAQTVDEGQELNFTVSATDVDGTVGLTLMATGTPTGATFTAATGTSGQFAWTPGFDQAGSYTVTFKATDSGTPPLSDTRQVVIIVRNANRPPVANGQAVTVDEDAQAPIVLQGSDPDGNSLTFAIVTPPANGTLTGVPPNVTYRPALNFNGVDQFSFKANDGQIDGNTAQVAITVTPVNDAPALTVPGAQTVNEGQALNFAVSATDIDSTVGMTLTATGTPTGANFTAATGTSGQFAWTPGATQSGTYTVTFRATDAGAPPLSDTKQVVITVADVPLLNAPQSKGINEGQALQFDVSAATAFAGQVMIAPVEVPDGAVWSNASPTAPPRFRWTPGFAQAGEYVAKFKATLNGANTVSETKEVRITVFDVQRNLAVEPEPLSILGAAGPLPQTVSDDGDKLGSSIAAGDLNGDGIPDLAIGAPGANGNGMNCGKVYVFFGKAGLRGAIDLAQQRADVELLGTATGDQLGSSLVIADLNGDGKNDLVAGAPFADVADTPDAGKVYGVFGPLAATASTISTVANVTVQGASRLDHFGASLAAGFIHTSNGPAVDLLIGAPGVDVSGVTPVPDAGAVYGFFGGPAFLKLINASAANFTLTGNSADAHFGSQLAAGNFNGDDFTDFAASAPNENAENRKNNGAVYLALGSAAIAGVKGIASFAAFSLAGADDGDAFGASLAMNDFNGDGRADLIIGAPGGDGPGNSRPGVGEIAVVYGNSAAVGQTADLMVYGAGATGDQYPDALGANLTAGDYTGDGVADIVLGAPGADPSDARRVPAGAIYLLFGQRVAQTGALDLTATAADLTVYGADPGDNIGRGSVAVGDVDASDVSDLILGIPQAWSLGNARQDAGEVRVLFGVKR